jgi:hypothetical protein
MLAARAADSAGRSAACPTRAEAEKGARERAPSFSSFSKTCKADRKLHGLKSEDWSTICLNSFAISTISSGDAFTSNVSQSKIKFPSLVM